MTFREKLAKEHPERIDKKCNGGVVGCPRSYGYEENCWCSNGYKHIDGQCTECWDREIPKTYEDGLNDAWELARKIATMLSTSERAKIFGYVVDGITVTDILRSFTPQEAIAKLKAHEEEIKVGDVVESDSGIKAVVIEKANHYFMVFTQDSAVGTWNDTCCKKTGKHIEIESLLGQIRGTT